MTSEWCTIESDPAVFCELIEKLGCQDIDVDEIYTLDSLTSTCPDSAVSIDTQFPSDLNDILLQHVHGYVFLFKYINASAGGGTGTGNNSSLSLTDSMNYRNQDNEALYYASQIVKDACATQAILSILLNMHIPKMQLGTMLTDFKSFTCDFDFEMKGLTIGNSDQIRDVHNSFARPEPFIRENDHRNDRNKKKGDAFHFIAYVPFNGFLFEIDGLKSGPVLLGSYATKQECNELVKRSIETRCAQYAENELNFTLLRIVDDIQKTIREKLNELEQYQQQLASVSSEDVDPELVMKCCDLRDRYDSYLKTQSNLKEKYKLENIRRKHNYIPFIMDLLQQVVGSN